jgi:hypothetical protein
MGAKQMSYDLLSEVLRLINEESKGDWSSARENSDEFVREMRREGNHAGDNNEEINEESSEDENIFDKARKEDEEDEESSERNEKVETPDESPSTLYLSDAMQYDKLIDALNQFRASHSLSDKEVSEEMKKYFNKLKPEEKKVLFVFMKGLTQVTLLDVDGQSAYSPGDLGFEMNKASTPTSEKRQSIKRKQKSKEDAKKMNTSPIKIGDSIQEKLDLLKIVRENA